MYIVKVFTFDKFIDKWEKKKKNKNLILEIKFYL